MSKKITLLSFDKDLKRELKDKKFREYFEEAGKKLDIAYKMTCLRENRKMSQAQLAKKIKTTQSSVARMEGGNQNFSTKMLGKIADALGCNLQVDFVLREKPNKPYRP